MASNTLTPEQLIMKFDELEIGTHKEVVDAMEKAVLNVEGVAKKNATPGHSPYEGMNFPTKIAQTEREGRDYSGAPYSLDNPTLIHMRDTIQGSVTDEGKHVMGVVWTDKNYAFWVHEGTSKMWARPFIYDAVMSEHDKTLKILSTGVKKAIADVCK